MPSQYLLNLMKTTIVVPTYREAENLPKLIPALLHLPSLPLKVIVVDDHSPDGTGEIADSFAERFPGRLSVLHRRGKLGLGSAYIQGFRLALQQGAEVIGQMDADFSHAPEKIIELYRALENCDVALGSRYVRGGQLDRQWPIWRKALSAFGNLYAREILRLPVQDVTGGYKLWRRQMLTQMPLERVRSNGYAFQVEMTYIAHRLGAVFQEVPIYFAERTSGESKMSLRIQLEAAMRVWLLLFEYRDLEV